MLLKKLAVKKQNIIFFADSGDFAFAILQSEKIDLAIVDLRMPIISGYEILETLSGNSRFKNAYYFRL